MSQVTVSSIKLIKIHISCTVVVECVRGKVFLSHCNNRKIRINRIQSES